MDSDLPLLSEARWRSRSRSPGMGGGCGSRIQGPLSWFLLILSNMAISGFVGMYSLQEIHWLQQQVNELRINSMSGRIHYNIMGSKRKVNLTENHNQMLRDNKEQESVLVGLKVQPPRDDADYDGDDDDIYYDEYVNDEGDEGDDDEGGMGSGAGALRMQSRSKRSTSPPKNKVHGKLRLKVKNMRRDVRKTTKMLKEMQTKLANMNSSLTSIGRVKSSHMMAKPFPINHQSEKKFRRSVSGDPGVYVFWSVDPSSDNNNFIYDGANGGVTVQHEGTYLIYAQVSYDPEVEQPGYTIVRENIKNGRELLDSCTTIPNHDPGPGKYIMCNTVTVSRLERHDVLYIAHSTFIRQVIVTETEKTFWGIVKLGA